jgi:hypothetical protein
MGGGQVELEIVPPAARGGDSRFSLYASQWIAAVGPADHLWSEATARGEFPRRCRQGRLVQCRRTLRQPQRRGDPDQGSARLEAGRQLCAARLEHRRTDPLPAGDTSGSRGGAAQAPFRGTARFNLAVAGTGNSVAEVLQRTTVSGPVSVSSAALFGANLGLAATRGDLGGTGGVTRFTDLELEVFGASSGLSLRSITGRAGSLRVYGGVNVDRTLRLNGALRTEVVSPRGVAGVQTRVGGTVTAPTYE